MINAMLVTVAEHGLTPSAATTRLTLLGSPESPQGAVAAGLLGAGSAFLGTPQQSAELFGSIQAQPDPESAARSVVKESLEAGEPLPGFGHPIHRMGDPRTEALAELQRELGIDDTHMKLAHQISSLLSQEKGKTVPLNAAGAIGAIVCDLGYPAIMGRAIAIVARSAGLVAHVIDETNEPIAAHIWTVLRTIEEDDHTSGEV
jgi:citrate synthase